MSATPEISNPTLASFAVRTLKLVISLLVHGSRVVVEHGRLVLGTQQLGTRVVLYYHSVPAAYRHKFECQMDDLSRRWPTVALDDIGASPAAAHSIAVTFDDALESLAQNAVPVLRRLGIPATVFAVAEVMGVKPPWGESYFLPDERVMSVKALCSLPQNICIGSHGCTHRDLMRLNKAEAAREIVESRRILEQTTGRPVTTFSFPFGSFNEFTVGECRKAGYSLVFTTQPQLVNAERLPFVVGRVAVDPWDWLLEFRLKAAGAYCWPSWLLVLIKRIGTALDQRKWNSGGNLASPQSTARTSSAKS